jgi:hypothetical protein
MNTAIWNPSDGIEDPDEMNDDFSNKKLVYLYCLNKLFSYAKRWTKSRCR